MGDPKCHAAHFECAQLMPSAEVALFRAVPCRTRAPGRSAKGNLLRVVIWRCSIPYDVCVAQMQQGQKSGYRVRANHSGKGAACRSCTATLRPAASRPGKCDRGCCRVEQTAPPRRSPCEPLRSRCARRPLSTWQPTMRTRASAGSPSAQHARDPWLVQLAKKSCTRTVAHVLGKLGKPLEHGIVVPARGELWEHVQLVAGVLAHEGGVVFEVVLPIARGARQLQAAYGQRLRCWHGAGLDRG